MALGLAGSAAAQTAAPAPATVLANVQQHYATARVYTAQFRYSATNAAFKLTKDTDGTVRVAKSGEHSWDSFKSRANGS